ncbi:prolyl oligopeptidase family serine peptidase [Phenylobacterium sp. SCN 70-31]|uniref:prolyl oligopeptidase family serine peptidase n=1 Tax=Phenylobacterium sp. SCN 70-31 TaxID=1660129 RepID=UPI00086CC6CF|nr:prolyl oligopeptidase family serine peptidase [Phenylobacterium sp. SCN 70-31]ODT86682.1 MAG: prolyl oligopeptidase [Phenylobacterium sp. SCN 70-31]
MRLAALATALAGVFLMGAAPPDADHDPYAWMEEIEGARALEWAKAENDRTLPQLKNDPRYPGLYADALAIATAKDRIPGVSFAGDGGLWDYWQDADHVRGVWRKTTLDSYRTGAPEWRTILDLDVLAKAEQANWVWKGASCLPPEDRLCLVSLSDGGKDAVEVREFDTAAGRFVEGGFRLPEGKHRFDWIDRDTLLIVTEWAKGDVTTSGYPYIAKLVKRGQTLSEARQVFAGQKNDGGYGVQSIVLRDPAGKVQAVVIMRPLDTFNAEYYLLAGDRPLRLDLPKKVSIQGYLDGRVIVSLEEDWAARGMKEGDLVDFDLAAVRKAPGALKPALVLRPTESQAVEQVATTKSRLVVALLDNVKGQVLSFRRAGGAWTSQALELPKDSTIAVASASEADDRLILSIASFLTPSSQWLADAAGGGQAEQLRTLPARFDASKFVTEQHWATSKDGTKVPYFVVRAKDIAYDGSNPTLLYAYGGFLVSQTPAYAATVGKLWLEKGGVYAVANIRGGGEFGPRWHNAGLKLNRMRVYDDFFAVSEDLISRKITSPKKLGIMGGSNGGLLMGVALTKRPELYNAVVIQVPLFDMIGYSHIGAGSSWIGEYGDPAVPEERAMLMSYSPYQNLKPGQPYPKVFIETSTKDDRVHPAHARKAAARLKEYGYDYVYYENLDGGHAAAANLNERAMRQALEFTYLTQRLMD